MLTRALWVRCHCGEFWCRRHRQHVADCACPPIEDWTHSPYERGFMTTTTSARRRRGPGRPRLPRAARRQQVTVRLEPAVLAALRATGKGWQTRINAILAAHLLAKD